MIFIYLVILFLLFSFIFFKTLIFFNINVFLSPITVSIIFSLIITKIIDYHFYSCKKTIKIHNELLVGISPDYPPYAYIENNTIVGFDIDLLKIIAKKLNLHLKFIPIPFHSILISLQLNTISIAASGLTGNKDRAEQMLISNTYFKNNLCAISLKENKLHTINQLKNKKIIINTGYSSESYIQKMNLTDTIIKLKSIADAIIGLNLHQGDVFITSRSSIIHFLKTPEAQNFIVFDLPQSEHEESISFLMNKNNSQLLEKINTSLKELSEDGTLDILIKKWNLEQ